MSASCRWGRRGLILAIVGASLGSAGCFTSWVASQVSGNAKVWDERVREQAVPLPGVEDWLTLTLVVDRGGTAGPSTASGAAPSTTTAPTLGVSCEVAQRGRDAVYHQAFRYGSRWKKATAVMFAVEGAIAAAYLLAGDLESTDLLYGAFLGLDAVGTGALFFAPRKEIYRRDERPVTTPVRSDCPEGLELAIGGEAFPVDAAGKLDEVGAEALARWRLAPAGPLVAALLGRSVELRVGLAASVPFPVGTLSTVASASGGE